MSLRGDEVVDESADEGGSDDEGTDSGTDGAVRGGVVLDPVEGQGVVPGAGVVARVHYATSPIGRAYIPGIP